jgi:hypothetical protein
MPFTFSHPAIILPFLKSRKKNLFSATGLIVGSIIPDFEYFLTLSVERRFGHTINGIFYFDLPCALFICFIFHGLIKKPLLNNLPLSDLNILTKTCHLVKIGDFKLIFLADSRIVEPALYQHIHKHIGDVDVLFIGMECDGAPLTWLYGPLLTKKLPRDMDGSRRLAGSDCAKGMSLVDIFNPKEIYVYAMGQEPWVEFISSIKYTEESNPIVQSNKLVDICRERGMIAERLYGEKELLYEKNARRAEIVQ